MSQLCKAILYSVFAVSNPFHFYDINSFRNRFLLQIVSKKLNYTTKILNMVFCIICIPYCLQDIPGFGRPSEGRTNRDGCPIYEEEYYQNVKQDDGSWKKVASKRDRCWCQSPVCVTLWIFALMGLVYLITSGYREGFQTYKSAKECIITDVKQGDARCSHSYIHVWIYEFNLTDANAFNRHCRNYPYNKRDGCREQPLYQINDTDVCYLIDSYCYNWDPNDDSCHCEVEIGFDHELASQFGTYIGGLVLVFIIFAFLIYLVIGCVIYHTFTLCWPCTLCKVKRDGMVNRAPHELSQFQRHLQRKETETQTI
eukprot:235073_1